MLVAIAFGLDPAITMLTVPFIAFLAGFGWACFGIMISGLMKSFENFSYVVSGVLTPMMLTAGTFFPLSGLPEWAQVLGNVNPLHHCVELVRHAAFGWHPGADLLHLLALLVFAVVTWRIAVWAMTRKLVT